MRRLPHTAVELQIAPLVDVCFLLLFFYLLTAADISAEHALSTPLPGSVEQSDPLNFPDFQQLQITALGDVILNGAPVATARSADLSKLRSVLARFRQSAQLNKIQPVVTLCPEARVPYQRLIEVLNACIAEGIECPLLAAPDPAKP